VRENIVSAFPDVSNDEAMLMAEFVLGIPRDDLDRFLRRFADLLERYTARPEFRRSVDFTRTHARQVDAIACRITPPRRRSSAHVYATALRLDPGVLWQLSWLRVAALVLFGAEG